MEYQARKKNVGLHSGAHEALLSISYIDGRRVGLLGLPSELVLGQPGTPAHVEALRGWRSGADQIAARYAVQPCSITTQPEPESVLE